MGKSIYFHIPGFFEYYNINKELILLMEAHPEFFYDNIKIGSVYGSFPSAIWNGGRMFFGFCFKEDMEKIVEFYNSHNIPLRFTFTNSLIEEKHLYDTYCNLIMNIGNNGFNQVLVNSYLLENYIRMNYPKYKIVSSTTKRIKDKAKINEEIEKNYHLVVLDYDLNHDFQYLKTIKKPEKVELLLDELCEENCPFRKKHYESFSSAQINFSKKNNFSCPFIKNDILSLDQVKNRKSFISINEIFDKYCKIGYNNFKLIGRANSINFVIDSYIYYFVREEYKELVRLRLKIFQNRNEVMYDENETR